MAEAYLLRLIGEERLALIDNGRLVAMAMARDGDGLAAGTVIDGRLVARQGRRGTIRFPNEDAIIEPWPAGASEGATVRAEIRRAAWREPGRDRLAKARPADGRPLVDAPSLAAGRPRPHHAWPDAVAVQWDQAWDQACLGRMAMASGVLVLQPTAAFLAVDVDGDQPDPAEATTALARVIILWGLGGNIIVDLPVSDRAGRQAAAAAFDAAMSGHAFERTAVNGFGLLQIVCPRPGPSILERALLDGAGNAAIALMESATRESRPGALRLVASPAIVRWIESRPHLIAALAKKTGRMVDVVADAMAGQGYVETRP